MSKEFRTNPGRRVVVSYQAASTIHGAESVTVTSRPLEADEIGDQPVGTFPSSKGVVISRLKNDMMVSVDAVSLVVAERLIDAPVVFD